ncbi:hypothetical protein F5051DRAFT_445900 [Lentinula edodes]|nr:hypothetical protein F5051DRAFT_445900 [Lentinula edodes]
MSHSRTQTVTTTSSAGPSRSRPTNPPPTEPVEDDDEALEEDNKEAFQWAEEKVRRMKARKAAAAAKKKAEEEAARKAAEEAQKQKEAAARELEERWRIMAEAATARSRRGSSPGGSSVSPRRLVVEIRKEKGKGKAKAQPVGGDPNDGGDGEDDDDNEDDRAPCTMLVLWAAFNGEARGRWKSDWRVSGGPREPDGSVACRQSAVPGGAGEIAHLQPPFQPEVGLVDNGCSQEEVATGIAAGWAFAIAEEEEKSCR